MTETKVQQKLGQEQPKTIEEQFESLTPGDRVRYNSKRPLTVTGVIEAESVPGQVILRGPRMGRHIIGLVGPKSDRNLVELHEDRFSIKESIESFEIVERQEPDESSRVRLAEVL